MFKSVINQPVEKSTRIANTERELVARLRSNTQ